MLLLDDKRIISLEYVLAKINSISFAENELTLPRPGEPARAGRTGQWNLRLRKLLYGGSGLLISTQLRIQRHTGIKEVRGQVALCIRSLHRYQTI